MLKSGVCSAKPDGSESRWLQRLLGQEAEERLGHRADPVRWRVQICVAEFGRCLL